MLLNKNRIIPTAVLIGACFAFTGAAFASTAAAAGPVAVTCDGLAVTDFVPAGGGTVHPGQSRRQQRHPGHSGRRLDQGRRRGRPRLRAGRQ